MDAGLGNLTFLKDWYDPPAWLVSAVQNDVTVNAVYVLAATSSMGKEDFLIRLARALYESRKVYQQKIGGIENDGSRKGGE